MSKPHDKRRPLTADQQALVEQAIPKLHRALNGDPRFKPYVRWYDCYDDAFQAAMIGVAHAALDFVPELGNQFWTYAYWRARAALQRIGKGGCRALMVGRAKYKYGDKRGWLNFEYLNAVGEVEGKDGPVPLIDLLGSDDDSVDRNDDKARVAELLRCLDARYRDVLLLRMQGFTLEEVGEMLDFTRERARQIETKAMDKLRRHAQLISRRKLCRS